MISPKFDGTNGKIKAAEVCHAHMAQMGHMKVGGCRRENRGPERFALVYRR
jgi:hypothetical protein